MKNKQPQPTTSILVVDDHPLVCTYLSSLIDASPGLHLLGTAGTELEAREKLKKFDPDLAIIDISLGESHGLNLIKRIRQQHPDTKVLVLSSHDESLYAPRALSAGALGYVNKQEEPDVLLDAIKQVLDNKIWLSETMSQHLFHDMFDRDTTPEIPSVSMLSDRELQVFELIGRGVKITDIAHQLHLSPKTVETHRDKAKKKLKLDSGLELTRYAMQWVMEDH